MSTPSGERVTVMGRVTSDGGQVRLTPSLVTGIVDRTGRWVAIVGDLPAPVGSHVSVDGLLCGVELTVAAREIDPGPDVRHRQARAAPGVAPDVASAVLDVVPDDDNLIGCGMTTTRSGGRVATVHVGRAGADVAAWVAAQPPGSVLVEAFVRDPGLPPVLAPPG